LTIWELYQSEIGSNVNCGPVVVFKCLFVAAFKIRELSGKAFGQQLPKIAESKQTIKQLKIFMLSPVFIKFCQKVRPVLSALRN
jgi:hypothetical protein